MNFSSAKGHDDRDGRRSDARDRRRMLMAQLQLLAAAMFSREFWRNRRS